MPGSTAARLIQEVDLGDEQKRLCLRVLSAFVSRAAGVATPSEVFNIVCKDGDGFVPYEHLRKLIADFLVPNGFVSIGLAHERHITDKGRALHHRLRDSVRLPSQVPHRELVAPNLDNLVSQIGQLIKELTPGDKSRVLNKALRRFC